MARCLAGWLHAGSALLARMAWRSASNSHTAPSPRLHPSTIYPSSSFVAPCLPAAPRRALPIWRRGASSVVVEPPTGLAECSGTCPGSLLPFLSQLYFIWRRSAAALPRSADRAHTPAAWRTHFFVVVYVHRAYLHVVHQDTTYAPVKQWAHIRSRAGGAGPVAGRPG